MGASETPRVQTKTIVKGLVLGIFLVLLGGVAIPFSFEAIIEFVINKMMILEPSSLVYQEWKDPSLPVYQKFYFFDLQNPEEVLRGGVPEVKEIGPYSYRLFLPKVNISFNSNDTVTSLQHYRYVFDPSESVGSEHDVFMSVNIPMWSVVYMFRDYPDLLQGILAAIIKDVGEEPFVQLSVRQFVWGYDEPLFQWLNKKNFSDIELPEEFADQFGFLLGRNNTEFGEYTVFTGVENITRVNLVDKFNGESELNFWTSDYANQIVGTDGMMYHQNIKDDELLHLFHPDLCRSMPYIFVKDDILKGVSLKMFGIAPWAFQNSTVFPDNEGFKVTDRDDVPTGLMRVDPCRFGSPMAVSSPHFFEGDPSLLRIKGLKADAEKHRNYFSVEPTLGMPFKLRMRLQINQYIEKNDIITQTGDVETMYLPVFWFENAVTATDVLISYYELGINLSATIATLMQAFCLCIGATLLVVFLTLGLFRLLHSGGRNRDSSVSKSDNESVKSTQYDNIAYTKSKSDFEEDSM